MTKKKQSKKKPVKKVKRDKLAKLMSKAKANRAANQHLIQDVRDDPALAEEVRELLCVDLRRVFEIPRELLGPSASRRRYREHGNYSEELVTYLIGDWAEFKRQAEIEDSLGVRQVRRNISKTLRAQDVASYADEHVKPWNGAYNYLDLSK